MRSLGRITFIVILLLLVLGILAFVLENQQLVSLSIMGWASPQLPVSIAVILALFVGLVIGPFAAWLYGCLVRKGHSHEI